MSENLKLSKEKRHRSSSSIVGPVLEATRSERRLNFRGSIPEAEDQFALAEARCDELQEKIDLVKGLKRKKKLKKRSATRVNEAQLVEETPYISVRTLPKKTGLVQQAIRMRKVETPTNPIRGYLDPARVEQHRMLGQVRSFNQSYRPQGQALNQEMIPPRIPRQRMRLARADGDSEYLPTSSFPFNEHSARISPQLGVAPSLATRASRAAVAAEVACGDDEVIDSSSGHIINDVYRLKKFSDTTSPNMQVQKQVKQQLRRRHVPREGSLKEGTTNEVQRAPWRAGTFGPNRRSRMASEARQSESVLGQQQEERPVVELFNKNRSVHSDDLTRCNSRDQDTFADESVHDANKDKDWRQPRRIKFRSRRYEQPTVASQMKQATMRYFNPTANYTAIPFIISKSCAPSHNLGVNIQQVLNGFKNQQPLSCIPLTIAHHMGLGHIPSYETKNMQPSLENREINAIRLGQRLVRLPSYKYVSYNRLLNLYRESEGMVSRFLRSIDRPHHFYTSMYNLATRDEIDGTTITAKSHERNHEAKATLAEYATLYREYEQVEKCLRESYSPELERRKEDLVRLLAAREEHIRKVVQEYKNNDIDGLRASASTAEDTYRMSTIKLSYAGDTLQ